ncbi:diaminopimelate epimerase [Alphaproteobacteria bacterium KMM 3653]|uniref:Diaminopimelate epimerase n=1 Tax=Harenicola maris TaxID=2841044 RepID=A0AAP2CUE7_9RHOB|nr:diaminopimelate epimerase [Harenicola maris]
MGNDVSSVGLPFMKMHGLGNDFVVIDRREVGRAVPMTPELAEAIGDRHRGVGFDQLAEITAGPEGPHLTFYNADGSMAAACGNATRCIAAREMALLGTDSLTLTTEHGTLQARIAKDGLTSVNMGHPQLTWDQIPLAAEMNTLKLPMEGAPSATGMGNPHCTFFVEDADAVDLTTLGPKTEHHPLYPERTNVQVAHVIAPDHLRMRVWERGVGMTLASGSSSCATAVAAHRRGLTGRSVRITLDGGDIWIDWREDGVWMTGPTAHVFSATFSPEFLAAI